MAPHELALLLTVANVLRAKIGEEIYPEQEQHFWALNDALEPFETQQETTMADEIGNVRGITGTSTALNGQGGQNAQKPSASGSSNPGGTKPSKPPEGHVQMPK